MGGGGGQGGGLNGAGDLLAVLEQRLLLYLPGCPPRPEMLLNAMLELTRQIEKKPLFKHREEIARAVEAAALSATPTHEMKGLLA